MKHEVRLRDRMGVEHPLQSDACCRNTLYHAQPQNLIDHVPELRRRGVRHFRIELLEGVPQDTSSHSCTIGPPPPRPNVFLGPMRGMSNHRAGATSLDLDRRGSPPAKAGRPAARSPSASMARNEPMISFVSAVGLNCVLAIAMSTSLGMASIRQRGGRPSRWTANSSRLASITATRFESDKTISLTGCISATAARMPFQN